MLIHSFGKSLFEQHEKFQRWLMLWINNDFKQFDFVCGLDSMV